MTKAGPIAVAIAGILLTTTTHATAAHGAARQGAGDGAPSDPNILYVGRWDTSSAAVYRSYWGGAYFETAFTGTTVHLKLAAPVDVYAAIDGGPDVYLAHANGDVNLTPKPLALGVHTLRVAARSANDVVRFRGLRLDAGATTVAPRTSHALIEFVGDSITAGFTDTRAALSDYAWLTGERLGVEHVQVAYPGICLVDRIRCFSPYSVGMSRQFFRLETVRDPNSPAWDFGRYQPAVVVINLGTNDHSVAVAPATFQRAYKTFLARIRVEYPHARIVALRTFGGYEAAPTEAAVAARRAAGDANVAYVDTAGWLGPGDYTDGTHPSDRGQMKVAARLAPILAPYLKAADGASSPHHPGDAAR